MSDCKPTCSTKKTVYAACDCGERLEHTGWCCAIGHGTEPCDCGASYNLFLKETSK